MDKKRKYPMMCKLKTLVFLIKLLEILQTRVSALTKPVLAQFFCCHEVAVWTKYFTRGRSWCELLNCQAKIWVKTPT